MPKSLLDDLADDLLPHVLISQNIYEDDGPTRRVAVQARDIVVKEFQQLLGSDEQKVGVLKAALERFHDKPQLLSSTDCVVVYLALLGKMQEIFKR